MLMFCTTNQLQIHWGALEVLFKDQQWSYGPKPSKLVNVFSIKNTFKRQRFCCCVLFYGVCVLMWLTNQKVSWKKLLSSEHWVLNEIKLQADVLCRNKKLRLSGEIRESSRFFYQVALWRKKKVQPSTVTSVSFAALSDDLATVTERFDELKPLIVNCTC